MLKRLQLNGDKDKNNKLISSLIDGDKLLEKY